MQKLRESKCSDFLAVSGISVKKMKLFNFYSGENAEDVDVPSIKTVDIGMHRYRREMETNGDMEPLQ